MAGFYKVVIRGVSGGQEINNILYYAPIDPSPETFNEDDANDLGAAVNAAWMTSMMGLLSNQYAFNGCDVSMVDEDGKILSPFVVSVTDTLNGGDSAAIDGPSRCVIMKFNCTTVSQATGHAVPRRSYVAVGPISTSHIGTTGVLLNPAPWQTAANLVLTQGHLINTLQFLPYRVGRTPEATAANPNPSPAGVGRVHSAVVRPYASFRRSRLFSPTGN